MKKPAGVSVASQSALPVPTLLNGDLRHERATPFCARAPSKPVQAGKGWGKEAIANKQLQLELKLAETETFEALPRAITVGGRLVQKRGGQVSVGVDGHLLLLP